MSDVKTYDLESSGCGHFSCDMVEDEDFNDGEWVKAEDYKKLKVENEELKKFLYEIASMIKAGDEDYACKYIINWWREQGGEV